MHFISVFLFFFLFTFVSNKSTIIDVANSCNKLAKFNNGVDIMGVKKERKFNFCLDDMIQQNINEKREITFKSLSRYLSISDEDKQRLIEEAKATTVSPCTFGQRVKKKCRRLV